VAGLRRQSVNPPQAKLSRRLPHMAALCRTQPHIRVAAKIGEAGMGSSSCRCPLRPSESGDCSGPHESTAVRLSRPHDESGRLGVQDRPQASTTVVSAALATGLCIRRPLTFRSRSGESSRSLSFARRRRSPAVSRRPRHRYAADLPCGLPVRLKHTPGSSRRSTTRQDAPLPARIRQVRGRCQDQDVIAPVPRVLCSATLAGPAPFGSTDTSRLCRGCSRPPRHHPGQAALSYTALLR